MAVLWLFCADMHHVREAPHRAVIEKTPQRIPSIRTTRAAMAAAACGRKSASARQRTTLSLQTDRPASAMPRATHGSARSRRPHALARAHRITRWPPLIRLDARHTARGQARVRTPKPRTRPGREGTRGALERAGLPSARRRTDRRLKTRCIAAALNLRGPDLRRSGALAAGAAQPSAATQRVPVRK